MKIPEHYVAEVTPIAHNEENSVKFLALSSTIAVSLTILASPAAFAGALPTVKDGAVVDEKGMTLYTFDNDTKTPGKSTCKDACAKNWPAAAAAADAKASGDFTTIKREDATHQWAWKGKPLYTWHLDKKVGDKAGDGIKNVWHVAK